MTDMELLELAAKAAGIKLLQWVDKWDGDCPAFAGYQMTDGEPWNPLADDGDALRLAVKLAIDVYFFVDQQAKFPWVGTSSGPPDFNSPTLGRDQALGEYPEADTRRAIVACAAEIGRKMP